MRSGRTWARGIAMCLAAVAACLSTGSAAGAVRSQQPSDARVVMVPVYFTKVDASAEESADLLSAATEWYAAASGGRLRLGGPVTAPLPIPHDCSSPDAVASHARTAAEAVGVDPRAVMVVLHPACGFRWEGLTTSQQQAGAAVRTVLLNGAAGRTTSVLVHELGHTLGLDHANLIQCAAGGRYLTLSNQGCSEHTYADPYDVMGNDPAAGMFSAANLAALGWLPPNGVVSRADGSASVRLRSLEGGAGVRAVRVRASALVTYWVEYRRPVGLDAGMAAAGVGIEVRRTVAGTQTSGFQLPTQFIDMAPESEELNALQPGASWTSPENVRIRVGEVSPVAAQVTVDFGAAEPTVPAPPEVTVRSGSGTLQIAWSAPDDNGRPVGRYDIQVLDASGAVLSQAAVVSADWLATRTATIRNLAEGTHYVVQVLATNDMGSSVPGQATS